MENITIETTIGNATFPVIKETIKVVSCGITWGGVLQVRIWTSEDQTSGYITEYNLKTGVRKLKRIKVSYISAESVKKYGRKCISEILPIIKTN